MNEELHSAPATRHRPRWLRWLAVLVLLLLALAASAWWYLHTRNFQRRMQALVQKKITAATGARVEMQYFHLSLQPLGIAMRGLVLHGREGEGQPPLAQIGAVRLGLTVRSLLRAQVDLTTVRIVRPAIHIEWLASGQSNLPHPSRPASGPPAESLFQLGVRRLQVRQGMLYLHNQRIPFSARLRHLHLRMLYAHGHYRGRLRFNGRHWHYGRHGLGRLQASLRFSLWPNDLKLRRWKLNGVGWQAHGAAMVSNLSQPRIRGQAWAQMDLHQIVKQWYGTRPAPLIAGTALTHILFAWQAGAWSASGGLAAQQLRPSTGVRGSQLGAWSALAQFNANPRRVKIAPLIVHGLAGQARLSLCYGLQARRGKYQAQGEVSGLRIGPLAQIVLALAEKNGKSASHSRSSPVLPRFAGRMSGRFALRAGADVAQTLRGRLALHIASLRPPVPAQWKTSRGQPPIPLRGDIQLRLGPGLQTGNIRQMRLAIPGAGLQAAGLWRRSGMRIGIQLRSRHLRVWPGWLRIAGLHLPALHGVLQFSGSLSGQPRAPALSGRVQVRRFALGRWRVDEAAITGSLNAHRMQIAAADLRLGKARVTAHGSLALRRYHPLPAGALAITASARQLPLSQIEVLLRRHDPVLGLVNLQLRVHGSLAHPEGQGHLQITRAVAWGQPIRSLNAALRLQSGTFTAAPLHIILPAAAISGRISYNLSRQRYRVSLASPGIRLQDLPPLQSARLHVSGLLRFHLTGAGTLAHPSGRLQVEGVDMRGNGEPMGQLHATLILAHQIARLDGTDTLPGGDLHLTAVLGMGPLYLVNARVDLNHYDADAWLRRFTPLRLTGHSQFSGALTLQGPLRQPHALVAQASFTQARIEAEGMALFNAGPLEFSLDRDVFTINQFHLLGTDTDLRASGTVGLHGLQPMNAAVTGSVNLALLHVLNHHIQSAGRLLIQTRIQGNLHHPQPAGTIQIQYGSLAEAGVPIAFDHMQSLIRLSGNRATVEQFTAHAGGGMLKASGFAAYTPAGLNYDFSLTGNNLRVLYTGISAAGDARLHLVGIGGSGLLSGDILLNRMAMTPNFDLAVFLANQRGSETGSTGPSSLGRLKLGIHLITGAGLQVASPSAHLQAQADLRVQGTLANPILLGHISGTEGRLRFAGNSFTVDRASIEFDDPFAINPLLNIVLSTTVQYYNITLTISGPMDKLNVTYRSDPPLSNSDIIALLATGQTAEQSTYASMSQQASSGFMGQSEQLLSAALENVAASRVRRIFGITRISVNPNAANIYTGASSGAITIEQQISPRLSFSYTQNLSSSSQNIVRVTWNISSHFSILISRNQFGIYGFSFHFRQQSR